MTDKIDEKFKSALEEKISLERLGDPEDVANAVLFLSSNLSDYITVKQYTSMEGCILVDKIV